MSKPTHTPGPWRVGAYGTTVMTGRPNSQANDTICSLCMPIHSGVGELLLPQDVRIEQVEANARLIAAAPDLLAACKAQEEASAFAAEASEGTPDGKVIPKHLMDKADQLFRHAAKLRRTAIAKAEGK